MFQRGVVPPLQRVHLRADERRRFSRGEAVLLGMLRGSIRSVSGWRKKLFYFIPGEFSPVANLQPGIANRSDGDPLQVIDWMSDRIAHLPHLPVASFSNRHSDRRAARLLADEHDFCGPGAAAVDDHPARKALEVVRIRHAGDDRLVDPCNTMARCVRRAARSPSFVSRSSPSES